MAENVNISTVLKRKLKGGKEFDILMPRVSCKTTTLGDGDTFFTVDRMKDWIEKFRHQTAKIALRLEGQTVEETVNNIYNFLYNHVQYEADGSLQQLRSPACTWMQRKQGVDCKSYSVFASSLLSNLGITHSIRQVKQPYFFPEEFTHVYVVIPKDQSKKEFSSNAPTFVLDATKHENVEVNYLEKVDLPMNKLSHVGLNAPQDERTSKIIANFESFCQFLLSKGMPLDKVNNIRKAVSFYTSQGKDPRINIVYDGVQVENIIYPVNLTQPVPFLAIQKAFYGDRTPGLNGLGFSFNDAFESFSGSIQSSSSSASGGGDVTGGIIDGGLTLASGAMPFGGIIKGILDKLKLSSNISNVLKYGLSSWGASMTPEEMKKRFAEICYPWLQEELAKTTTNNVDTQLTSIDVQLRGNAKFFEKLAQNHSKAKSTKIANEWASQECTDLLKKTIDGFNAQFQANGTTVTKTKVGAKSSAMQPYPIVNFSDKRNLKNDRYWDEVDYFIYNVDKRALNSWNSQQMQTPTNNGNTSNDLGTVQGGTVQTAGFGDSGQQGGNGGGIPEKTKSSNTGIIIGGVALASLPFLLPMIKGGNPSPKASVKTTKKSKK